MAPGGTPHDLVRVNEVTGVLVARLAGEIDQKSAPTIETRLSSLADGPLAGIVVDLTEVRYLDSSAVRALFLVADRLALRGRELHVVVPQGSRLSRLVSIIQLDAVVAVHNGVDEACSALRGATGPPSGPYRLGPHPPAGETGDGQGG